MHIFWLVFGLRHKFQCLLAETVCMGAGRSMSLLRFQVLRLICLLMMFLAFERVLGRSQLLQSFERRLFL